MVERLRLILMAVLLAGLSAGASLLLLTWMNDRLTRPAVVAFDLGVQGWVHGLNSPHLTRVMLALTWIGSIRIFASSLAVVLLFLFLSGHRHATAVLAGAMGGAMVLNETLKLHFHRPRPVVPWSIGDEHTFSFPSGHSLFSCVLYGTLAYLALNRRTSMRRRMSVLVPAVLLPGAIGLSRIYLGMHFPTDVLAGYGTGLLWLGGVILIDQAASRARASTLHPSCRSVR